MAYDSQTINAVLKERWTDQDVVDQIVQEAPTLDVLEPDDKFTPGSVARTAVRVTRDGSFTALGDTEDVLNAAGNDGTAQLTWNLKHFFQPVKVLHSALVAADNDSKAVVNAVDFAVESASFNVAHHIERQLFSPGDGTISGFTTGGSANTQTLDAVTGPRAIASGWLYVGQQIDIGTLANGSSLVSGGVITAITGNTITWTGTAAAVTAGTHFISQANTLRAGTDREMNSLPQIFGSNSSIVGGLNPAGNPTWKPAFVDSTTTSLSLANLIDVRTSVRTVSQGMPNLIIAGPAQFGNLFKQFQAQYRYNDESKASYGSNILKFNYMGWDLLEDPKAPVAQLFALDKRHVGIMANSSKPQWLSEPKLTWIGGASLQGTLGWHLQLWTNQRNSGGAFTNLT